MTLDDLLKEVGMDEEEKDKNTVKDILKKSKTGFIRDSKKMNEYTENDVANVKAILLYRKAGFSSKYIGSCIFGNKKFDYEAVNEKKPEIINNIEYNNSALELLEKLKRTKGNFLDRKIVNELWDYVNQQRKKGKKYFDDVLEKNDSNSDIYFVYCPKCHSWPQAININYFEFLDDIIDERNMGEEIVHNFETSSEQFICPSCGTKYGVSGWISEYPTGCFDGLEINTFTDDYGIVFKK